MRGRPHGPASSADGAADVAGPDGVDGGTRAGEARARRVSARERWDILVDAVEESYEYFLAYAAQGVSGDGSRSEAASIRDFVNRMHVALEGLADGFQAVVDEGPEALQGSWDDMLGVLRRDAEAARAAVRLVASREVISSQLVDNLNANIHLRAVLTDVFLLDEALGPPG